MSLSLDHFEKIESYLPFDLLSPTNFLLAFVILLSFLLVRYFVFVGVAYFLFWQRGLLSRARVHDQCLPKGQISFEIYHSALSSIVFAFFGVFLGVLWQKNYSKFYLPIDHYGLWYLPFSFVALALMHELYFYGTHRLMHLPSLYRVFHHSHHISRKVSPWASFSFSVPEAALQALFLPLVVTFLPIHPVIFLSYLVFMTVTAISNHLGVELFSSTKVRALFISASHHQIHHKRFNENFGLYFCFSDRIFGTESKGDFK